MKCKHLSNLPAVTLQALNYHEIIQVESFKYLGSKILANGNAKEGITEIKCYHLARDILKWEKPKKGKLCLFQGTTSPY